MVGKDVVVRKRKHLQTCCVKPDKESQAKREIDNVLSTETVRLVLELDTDLVVVLCLILINLVFLLFVVVVVIDETPFVSSSQYYFVVVVDFVVF